MVLGGWSTFQGHRDPVDVGLSVVLSRCRRLCLPCENTADIHPGAKVVITFVTKIGSLSLTLFLGKSKSE